ncbi:MAG: hypothetical protein RLZZ292_1530 [Bacteroidota bacterium]
MKKKLIAFAGLFVLVYGLGVLLGCCGETLFYFDVKNIQVANSTATKEIVDEKAELSFREYFLKIKMKVEYVAEVTPTYSTFLPSANALSCISQGEYGSKTLLDTILIHTITKYDDDHIAGSCLNDITNVSLFSYGSNELRSESELSKFIKEKKSGLGQSAFKETELWFSFNKQPFFDNQGLILPKQHQFIFTIKFKDQPALVDTTALITILPF